MVKKKNRKKIKKVVQKEKKPSKFSLPEEVRRWICGVMMFLIAIIIVLAFFNAAGFVGRLFKQGASSLFGGTVFAFPLLFVLGGLAFFFKAGLGRDKGGWLISLAMLILALGISGILGTLSPAGLPPSQGYGGLLGYFLSLPFLAAFGRLATQIIFISFCVIGGAILWHLFGYFQRKKLIIKEAEDGTEGKPPTIIKKIFAPKFRVKEIGSLAEEGGKKKELLSRPLEGFVSSSFPELKTKPLQDSLLVEKDWLPPPLDLLEADKGVPNSGDIQINSAIIKRTLQNFYIQVEMSEVNVGPTVTQYTLKPAEGVKLSKITALTNDLSLALASHPIRIEAPIPGRPLVGIEVPNKAKTLVRLRNLLDQPSFQNSVSPLVFALGRDVAGNPIFTDLARMPHLLVAGSTGTGKTICLNAIILSLLYRNSPKTLRLILIDPKRVEFGVYNELPHLLTDVVFDVQRTVNVLKWAISEMERRFELLSAQKAKDIGIYNKMMVERSPSSPLLPFLIIVIDELADLMAARGREIEATIVRLAQMARAVGIHLIVATQRPSVEVITGLIKANITSRISFQVASQVDSRTVLDAAGSEKLLGAGDMLFLSAEVSKPKRIQGAYVSEKEVKRVANYIVKNQKPETEESGAGEREKISQDKLAEFPSKKLEISESGEVFEVEDPLYEEAKRVVIEARKASASLLQRRLRVGYARAARLIDMLEEEGVVGPGEGAKPREVYAGAGEKKDESDDGYVKV